MSAVRSPARVRTTIGVWQPSVEVFKNRILIELMPRIGRYHAVPCTTCAYRYSGTQHVHVGLPVIVDSIRFDEGVLIAWPKYGSHMSWCDASVNS